MASIRRTLSYPDRPYRNVGSPFSVQFPSQKFLSNVKNPSPVSTFISRVFSQKYPRKGGSNTWMRSVYRCCLFFVIGFFLGMIHFVYVQDVPYHELLSFVKMSPPASARHDSASAVAVPSSFEVLTIDKALERFNFSPRKQLIVITPTYNRALQAFYLTRLGQVLRLVNPPLLWIVVEMNLTTEETAAVLRKTGIMHRHLACCTGNSIDAKDTGGYHQRNKALEHIEFHKLDGIVYFADEDNIYSLELFESMREVSRVSAWPVAAMFSDQSKNGSLAMAIKGPIINGKSKNLAGRFHVDMSGFAFNSTIMWDSKRWQRQPSSGPIRLKNGFEETNFVEQLLEEDKGHHGMEGIRSGCSKIMNWHLHLDDGGTSSYPRSWLLDDNLDIVLPVKA